MMKITSRGFFMFMVPEEEEDIMAESHGNMPGAQNRVLKSWTRSTKQRKQLEMVWVFKLWKPVSRDIFPLTMPHLLSPHK